MTNVVDDRTEMRAALERAIAVINGKGGVGKTTIASNVGGLLAHSNYRVLTCDMDPQGNMGLDLGYADGDHDDRGRSLAQALLFDGQQPNILRDVRPGLDAIVGGDALHHASASLAANQGRLDPRDALARVLAPLASDYDMILIDCPPGNEALQSAAIGAARWALVPSSVDDGTKRGLIEIARRLDSVIAVNPDLDLLGVVLFDIETQATVVQENARQMVAEAVGSRDVLFNTFIRHAKSVAQQARRRGLLVHELDDYARNQPEWWKIRRGEVQATDRVSKTAANVADDMHALTSEIVERLSQRETEAVSA